MIDEVSKLIASHWTEIAMIAVDCGVLKFAWNKFKQYTKMSEARDNAVRSLLRADIISMCHKSIKQGFIPLYNRENLIDMYHSYKTLGGNGAVKEIYEQALELPHGE